MCEQMDSHSHSALCCLFIQPDPLDSVNWDESRKLGDWDLTVEVSVEVTVGLTVELSGGIPCFGLPVGTHSGRRRCGPENTTQVCSLLRPPFCQAARACRRPARSCGKGFRVTGRVGARWERKFGRWSVLGARASADNTVADLWCLRRASAGRSQSPNQPRCRNNCRANCFASVSASFSSTLVRVHAA